MLLPELHLLRMDVVTEDVRRDPIELLRHRGHQYLVLGRPVAGAHAGVVEVPLHMPAFLP